MDVYSKPTDAKRYVSFKSNHPTHCSKNISFSLARKICIIAERDSLKKIKLKELETSLNKTLKIPQNELRNVKKQEKKEDLTFYFNL